MHIFYWWEGPSWSWSYGSWIYNYWSNQCLSPLKLWVRIPLWRGVLDTTLCDKVCQWLSTGRWFCQVSSTNKTDRHDITEIMLKVALNTINQANQHIGGRSCMSLLTSVSTICWFYFEIVPTVWYFLFFFHFIFGYVY
jgi:hypothetical protein